MKFIRLTLGLCLSSVAAQAQPLNIISPAITNGTSTNLALSGPSFPQTDGTWIKDANRVTVKNHYNVTGYGAKVDGSTDDTPAFLDAVAVACAAGGGVIDIPAGTTVVDTVPVAASAGCSNVYFQGAGIHITYMQSKTSTSLGVVFGDGTNSFQHGGIDGVTFTGATPNVAQTGGNYVRVRKGLYVSLTNDGFENGYTSVLYDDQTEIDYFDHNYFSCVAPTGSMIEIDGGNDQYFSTTVGNGQCASSLQGQYGMLVTKNGALFVNDVDLLLTGTGLAFIPCASCGITWAFLSHVGLDSNSGNGFTVNAAQSGSVVQGIMITDLWTSTNANNGVNITASGGGIVEGLTINGSRAFNNGTDGMVISGNVVDFRLSAGTVAGNSTSASGTYSGVSIGAGVSKFSITDSTIGQAIGFSNTQDRNIIVAAGASDNFDISHNDLTGAVGTPLLNLATGTHQVVDHNRGSLATVSLSPTGTSFSYTAVQEGTVYTVGTLTAISRTHFGVTTTLPDTVGQVLLASGDVLSATYASAPTMTFIPN